jgi:hypothetical protein
MVANEGSEHPPLSLELDCDRWSFATPPSD